MIHHATRDIPPSALDVCLDFYALIGFVEVQPPAGIGGRAAWLEASRHGQHTQIHLMLVDGALPNAGHVAIICSGYDQTLARLRAAGHEVQARTEHWGSPRSFARDPAGNVVELMAWPPGEEGPSDGQGTAA